MLKLIFENLSYTIYGIVAVMALTEFIKEKFNVRGKINMLVSFVLAGGVTIVFVVNTVDMNTFSIIDVINLIVYVILLWALSNGLHVYIKKAVGSVNDIVSLFDKNILFNNKYNDDETIEVMTKITENTVAEMKRKGKMKEHGFDYES